jgi:hypothetical protein
MWLESIHGSTVVLSTLNTAADTVRVAIVAHGSTYAIQIPFHKPRSTVIPPYWQAPGPLGDNGEAFAHAVFQRGVSRCGHRAIIHASPRHKKRATSRLSPQPVLSVTTGAVSHAVHKSRARLVASRSVSRPTTEHASGALPLSRRGKATALFVQSQLRWKSETVRYSRRRPAAARAPCSHLSPFSALLSRSSQIGEVSIVQVAASSRIGPLPSNARGGSGRRFPSKRVRNLRSTTPPSHRHLSIEIWGVRTWRR